MYCVLAFFAARDRQQTIGLREDIDDVIGAKHNKRGAFVLKKAQDGFSLDQHSSLRKYGWEEFTEESKNLGQEVEKSLPFLV